MAHKITRNITNVNDIKKLGMNVTNECDLVSDGKNVYVRVGKEYRQIDNDSKPDLTNYYNKTQVDNLLKEITDNNGELSPLWIENFAEFGFVGGGAPSGVSKYDGGNYVLEVSGNSGDDFVTVTGGDIVDGGGSWAGVLKDDDGNWSTVRVMSTDGIDKVTIYPALTKNITNGELGNLHDAELGQHYTERGYFALAQHIFKYDAKKADRNNMFSGFNPLTDDISESKWKFQRQPTLSTLNIMNTNNLIISDSNTVLNTSDIADYNLESIYEENIENKVGFVELNIRGGAQEFIVEFYVDDDLKDTRVTTANLNNYQFNFKDGKTAKVRIFRENPSGYGSLRIGRISWYEHTTKPKEKILPPHSKVVFLGDSWGEYHDRAITRELSRLLSNSTGTTVDIFNDSLGGTTSKWGLAWFEEYVLKNRPTHVIINFFTNDLNSIKNNLPYNFMAPDGQTRSYSISNKTEWMNNLKSMADLAISNGIQPIIVAPAPVEGDTQLAKHLYDSSRLLSNT